MYVPCQVRNQLHLRKKKKTRSKQFSILQCVNTTVPLLFFLHALTTTATSRARAQRECAAAAGPRPRPPDTVGRAREERQAWRPERTSPAEIRRGGGDISPVAKKLASRSQAPVRIPCGGGLGKKGLIAPFGGPPSKLAQIITPLRG
jgi:hypothetical protein